MTSSSTNSTHWASLITPMCSSARTIVFASRIGPALTTADGWKLRHINKTDGFQLYNVLEDYREENDLASEYPDKVNQLGRELLMACDGNFAYGNPDMHRAYYVHNQKATQELEV